MKRLGALILLSCLGFAVAAAAQDPVPAVSPSPQAVPEPAATPGPEPAPTLDPDAVSITTEEPVVVPDLNAPAKTDITLDRASKVRAGVGFFGPIGAGVSLQLLHGIGADIKDDGTRVNAVCAVPMRRCAQGFLVRADAGSGGGKLSLGLGAWAKVNDEDFKGTAGVGLRLAVAHTWGDPIGQPPGLTYVGPELDLSILRINLTLGALFRVAGDGGSSALFSWGLGFGL
jgi:hypothetical protein